MRAAVVVGKENIILEDRKKPQIDLYRNVLLHILYCGVCGSDMPKYFGNRIKRYPLVLGHEFCGIVEEGPDNLIGKLVSGIPMWYCKECENCKNGDYELCSNHKYVGSTIDGAMQEYLTIPEEYILDANILNNNAKLAALIEPFAVAIHASNIVKKMNYNTNDKKICIVGDGVIGVMIYLALELYLKIPKERIDFIKREDIVESNQYDLCFECSGKVGGFNSAIKTTKYKGQIIQLGIIYSEFFKKDEDVDFDKLLRKEQNLQGVWNSNFKDDWIKARDIIANNQKLFDEVITAIYPLEDITSVFNVKKNSKAKTLKLMIGMGE